jgi:hypothetical protein
MSNAMTWEERNRAYLLNALARVRRGLERPTDAAHAEDDENENEAWPADLLPPPALDTVCRALNLSPFERDVLLLCAGMELDADWPALIAHAHGGGGGSDLDRQATPTFGLALARLAQPHWSALASNRPLRYWRLLDLGEHAVTSLTTAPLRIDEAILHFLVGVASMDVQLQPYLEPISPIDADTLPPSQARAVAEIVQGWQGHATPGAAPVIDLCGRHAADLQAVAAVACAQLRLALFAIEADDLPATANDRQTLARVWQREACLDGAALLIRGEARHPATIASFIASAGGYVIVAGDAPSDSSRRRRQLRVTLDAASTEEREQAWRAALGPAGARLNGAVRTVAAEFDLSQADIEAAARLWRGAAADADADADAEVAPEAPPAPAAAPAAPSAAASAVADNDERGLWRTAQSVLRTRLDGLADRIAPRARWADLVLPTPQLETLRLIAAHLRHRQQVYDAWGFADQSARGLGLSALFTGASGTGKTLAAEVLASELGYELYRLDLSQVVSKYIGETEKNLKRVFDAAESGGTILLFDEADALFGRRSEVRDSHDRYANIEVSYLLQRMEAYRGLAILTTNMKQAIDVAFLRRIRFVVAFPFPDVGQRTEIWRRVLSGGTPTGQLDLGRLARLNVPGGNIRNIALHAAFLAADSAQAMQMSHLLRAARSEYAKLERVLTDAEIAGWI